MGKLSEKEQETAIEKVADTLNTHAAKICRL